MHTTILTRGDGSLEGHAAGCRDIARKVTQDGFFGDPDPWTEPFTSKRHAFLEYNADFLAESDEDDESNCWPILWFRCADALPEDGEV